MAHSPQRRFQLPGISHLTSKILAVQVVALAAIYFTRLSVNDFTLIPAAVLQGEFWRIFTFLAMPPSTHPVFMAFAWYVFWLMGSSLEHEWGDRRYTVFWLIGWLANVLVAFLYPVGFYTNAYLMSAVFLAFAYRNPNFTLHLFFILPVRIKWLALITWGIYALTLLFAPWPAKLLVLANTVAFFLFFGRELLGQARSGHWKMQRQRERIQATKVAFHTCNQCGATDLTHPERQFFYEDGVGICEVCLAKANDNTEPVEHS